jgi:hypothetical protein
MRDVVLSAYEITGKLLMLYVSTLPASGSQTFKYRADTFQTLA